MKKTPIASSRLGSTVVLSKESYQAQTVEPRSEFHEADLVDTLYFRRKHHSEGQQRIGFKY